MIATWTVIIGTSPTRLCKPGGAPIEGRAALYLRIPPDAQSLVYIGGSDVVAGESPPMYPGENFEATDEQQRAFRRNPDLDLYGIVASGTQTIFGMERT